MKRNRSGRYFYWLVFVGLCGFAVDAGFGQGPADEKILRLMAQQQEALGRFSQAGELYGQLVQQRPQDMGLYMSARRCYLEAKEYTAWEILILSVQKIRRDLQYEVDLAQIAFILGRREAARQKWTEVITGNPHDERAYHLVGGLLMELQQLDEAASVYLRGRKSLKDDNRFIFELVRIYGLQSNYSRLTEEYLGYLKQTPAQIQFVQGQLSAAARTPSAHEEIIRTVQREVGEEGDLAPLRYRLLGALYTQAKEYKKALAQYQGLEKMAMPQRSEEVGFWYYTFILAAISDAAYAEARKSIEMLLAQPRTSEALRMRAEFLLATILENETRFPEAIAAYEKIIAGRERSPEAEQSLFRVAAIYLNNYYDVEKAEWTYLRILGRTAIGPAQRLETMQKLSECALVRGDLKRSGEYLQSLIQEAPADAEIGRRAQWTLAQLDFFRGRRMAAIERLAGLVETYSTGKTPTSDDVENDVLDLYIFLNENRNDSLGIGMVGTISLMQRQRRYGAALDSAALFLEKYPRSTVWPRLFAIKIDLLRQLNRPEEALALCRSGLQDSSRINGERMTRTMAEIYDHDLKDRQKAQQVYEEFLHRYPASIYIDQIRQRIREMEKESEPMSEE